MCNRLQQAIRDFGYALCDIVRETSLLVASLDLHDKVVAYVLDKLSNIEYRLSHGVSEKLQLGAFVGVFTVARQMLSS